MLIVPLPYSSPPTPYRAGRRQAGTTRQTERPIAVASFWPAVERAPPTTKPWEQHNETLPAQQAKLGPSESLQHQSPIDNYSRAENTPLSEKLRRGASPDPRDSNESLSQHRAGSTQVSGDETWSIGEHLSHEVLDRHGRRPADPSLYYGPRATGRLLAEAARRDPSLRARARPRGVVCID